MFGWAGCGKTCYMEQIPASVRVIYDLMMDCVVQTTGIGGSSFDLNEARLGRKLKVHEVPKAMHAELDIIMSEMLHEYRKQAAKISGGKPAFFDNDAFKDLVAAD